MSKWNNPLKPFQEKHFQKGQVYLRLAIIYLGVQLFTQAALGLGSFLKDVGDVCQKPS